MFGKLKLLRHPPKIVVGFEYKPKLWRDASIIAFFVTIPYSLLYFNNISFIHFVLEIFKDTWIRNQSLYIFVDIFYLIFYFLVAIWAFQGSGMTIDFPKLGSDRYPSAISYFFLKLVLLMFVNEYITLLWIGMGVVFLFLIVIGLTVQFLLSLKIIFGVIGVILGLITTQLFYGIQEDENTVILISILSIIYTACSFVIFKLVIKLKTVFYPSQQRLFKTFDIKDKTASLVVNKNNIFVGTQEESILVYSPAENQFIAKMRGHRDSIKKIMIKRDLLISLDHFFNLGVWSANSPFHFIRSELEFPFEDKSNGLEDYLQLSKFYNQEFQRNLDSGLSVDKAFKLTINNYRFKDQKNFGHHSHEFYRADVMNFSITDQFLLLHHRGNVLDIFSSTFNQITSINISELSLKQGKKNDLQNIENAIPENSENTKQTDVLLDFAISNQILCLLLGKGSYIDDFRDCLAPFNIRLYTINDSGTTFFKAIDLDPQEHVKGIIGFSQDRIIYYTSKEVVIVNNYQTRIDIKRLRVEKPSTTYLETAVHQFKFPYLIVAEFDYNSKKSSIKIYSITDYSLEQTINFGKRTIESIYVEENYFYVKLGKEALRRYELNTLKKL